MHTLLESPAVALAPRHVHPDARKMANAACRDAIEHAGLKPGEIDLLLNCGLYHDRALGEPALAALIQEDVGINPEDPHGDGHGSFSFDIANGGCGVLTGLQVADGFLRSGAIEHALVVASDASPGHGIAPGFPFAASGAAVVCSGVDGPAGLVGFKWESEVDPEDTSRSRVLFEQSHNVLHIEQDAEFGSRAAVLAGKTALSLLADHQLRPDDVDLVIASPLTPSFLEGLSGHAGIGSDRIMSVGDCERVHTAALLVALEAAEREGRLAAAHRVLLVSAGAGIVVGAALLVR
ncbi:MAG: 3-oxoacyl-[acyl-carrier-protein] synthase III C-terminal domain-containing protein [Acidimicrobiales bacterium]